MTTTDGKRSNPTQTEGHLLSLLLAANCRKHPERPGMAEYLNGYTDEKIAAEIGRPDCLNSVYNLRLLLFGKVRETNSVASERMASTEAQLAELIEQSAEHAARLHRLEVKCGLNSATLTGDQSA